MRVIVIMKTDQRMVDLTKMIQLVEAALEQLAVNQEYVDPVSCLDDLHGKIALMVEGPVADNSAVL